MKVLAPILLLSLFSSSLWAFPLTPNADKTKGSLCTRKDDDYSGVRYGESIPYCERNVNPGDKARIYRSYGIPEKCWKQYTIDHFYPLSMGGSNHSDNLWPEHKFVKETRMNLELETFERLRDGQITQKEALSIIREAKLHPAMPASHSGSDCDELDSN